MRHLLTALLMLVPTAGAAVAWDSKPIGDVYPDCPYDLRRSRGLGYRPESANERETCPLDQLCPAELRSREREGADKAKTLSALEYAADQGHLAAQWKLGRMYVAGDGVPKDDKRAFDYFSQITNAHPDEAPGTAQGRIVAKAFVAVGQYYLYSQFRRCTGCGSGAGYVCLRRILFR
jgi:TPR repeat protein